MDAVEAPAAVPVEVPPQREPVSSVVLFWLKFVVGIVLMVAVCTIFLPLLIPLGFASWLGDHLFQLNSHSYEPWKNVAAVLGGYAWFIGGIVLMFRTKRIWVFLLTLAILLASTWIAWRVWDAAFAW